LVSINYICCFRLAEENEWLKDLSGRVVGDLLVVVGRQVEAVEGSVVVGVVSVEVEVLAVGKNRITENTGLFLY